MDMGNTLSIGLDTIFFGVEDKFEGFFGETEYFSESQRDSTTIYTVFRSLIQDFTIYGATIFVMMLGYISGKSYQFIQIGKLTYYPILAGIYSFFIFGYLESIFNWNSVWLSYIIFFYLLYNQKLKITK